MKNGQSGFCSSFDIYTQENTIIINNNSLMKHLIKHNIDILKLVQKTCWNQNYGAHKQFFLPFINVESILNMYLHVKSKVHIIIFK